MKSYIQVYLFILNTCKLLINLSLCASMLAGWTGFLGIFFHLLQPVLIYVWENRKLLVESNNGIEFFLQQFNALIYHAFLLDLAFFYQEALRVVSDHFSFFFFIPSFFFLFCISHVLQTAYLHPYCPTVDNIPSYWVHYNGSVYTGTEIYIYIVFKWQDSAKDEKSTYAFYSHLRNNSNIQTHKADTICIKTVY